jgi:acetyl-CoA acetyltransferase
MLMGPVDAVPKALKRAGLALHDIQLIEMNEAFASSTVACLKILAERDGTDTYESLLERTNIHGSGISLGHPPGATGAILTTKLMHEMKRRPELRYGMVSMCVGGGHGFAAIWERANGGAKR